MKLCLDEHYAKQIAVELREDHNLDVRSVKERAELVALSDAELIAAMQGEQRALLTENVRDFAPLIRQLVAEGGSHHGVVYSSSASMPRSRATIGVFVRALAELMNRYPGDRDFVDRVDWLSPQP